jgi:hypothetical protein
MLRFFVRLFPVLILCAVILVAGYDWINPAPFARDAYRDQFRICVGASSWSDEHESSEQRVYILVPKLLDDPGLVVVTHNLSHGTTRTDNTLGGLIGVAAALGLCVWATLRLWIVPIRALGFQKFREKI